MPWLFTACFFRNIYHPIYRRLFGSYVATMVGLDSRHINLSSALLLDHLDLPVLNVHWNAQVFFAH